MRVHKLKSTDAFVVFDLEKAEHNVGPTRLAPKILLDGAVLLARTVTYQFASFEMKKGGASAGINAKPDVRDVSVSAFVDEVEPMARDGLFLTDPGKGLDESDFAKLRAVDPRDPLSVSDGPTLVATGAVVAAEHAVGGLEGRSVAIEGFDRSAPIVAAEVAARGGTVIAVATARGTAVDSGGFNSARLGLAFAENGADFVAELGGEVSDPHAIFGVAADVIFAGSKPGVIDHENATSITARAVVPTGPVPVTTKALAMLQRAGVVVLPDFITTAGEMFAAWPSQLVGDDARTRGGQAITAALDEVLGHDSGAFLAACYRAEAFLKTWQVALPFGRPLA